MPFFGKSDSILASVGSKRDAQHKYMTKKAKRNILRQIQQKYLQEIDFSNLPKWEEAPPEMGGGTSRYGRRHLPKWEEAPPEMGGGTVLRSRAREN